VLITDLYSSFAAAICQNKFSKVRFFYLEFQEVVEVLAVMGILEDE